MAQGMLVSVREITMGKALAAWLMVTTAIAAPAASPRDVVQAAVTRVIVAVQKAELEDPSPTRKASVDAHRAEIRRIAGELFDFEEMARRALSRFWTVRSPEEQAEFVRLFTELLERTYIGKIEAYSGEKIIYLGEAVDPPYASVRSRVVTRRRTETPLDYRLHLRDGRWKVYDVLIDNVSFVSTYRSEFSRILQKESYASLVDKMRKRQVETTVVERAARGQ